MSLYIVENEARVDGFPSNAVRGDMVVFGFTRLSPLLGVSTTSSSSSFEEDEDEDGGLVIASNGVWYCVDR